MSIPFMKWIIFALSLSSIGCDSLKVLETQSGSRKVQSLSQYIAEPGETIVVRGTKIDDSIDLFVDDAKTQLTLIDGSSASFIFPGSKGVISKIMFQRKTEKLGHFPIVNKTLEQDIPLADIAESELCSDMIVRNKDGLLVRGKAECHVAREDCQEDGQTDCVSNEDFTYVEPSSIASKVLAGYTVAGVQGTVPNRSKVCTEDGETSCVVDGFLFKAVAVENLAPSDLRSGLNVGGVEGSILTSAISCSSDAQTLCQTNSDFPSADLSQITAQRSSFLSSQTFIGVSGTLDDCSEDGETTCIVKGPDFVNILTAGAASKIVAGQTLGGVIGVGLGRPADCSQDSGVACVAVAAYPAIDKSNMSTNLTKIASSLTVAGVTGMIPMCSSDGQSSCVADANFPALDKNHVASNLSRIRMGTSIAGLNGSLNDCSSDGGVSCVTGSLYPALDKSIAAPKILVGQTLGGISGTAPAKPLDCSTDGGVNCFTVSAFPAIDKNNSAAKILTGQTIAGVSGTAALTPDLCSADNQIACVASTNFPAVELSVLVGSRNRYSSSLSIAGQSGELDDCGSDGESNCRVLGPSFRAANTVGIASKIAVNEILAGVTGTAPLKPSDCNGDGQTDCTTSIAFPALDASTSPSKIVAGQVLGGVTGTAMNYRPSTCRSDGEQNCTTDTDFVSLNASTAGNSIAFGDTLGGISGNAAVRPSDCSTDGAEACVTSANFPSMSHSFVDSQKHLIKSNFQLIGVTGTVSSCLANGSLGCETTSAFPSTQLAGAAAKILSGTSVGSIAGTAPVRPADCNSDGGIACVTSTNFPALEKSLVIPSSIRSGTTLGGVAGAMANCSSDGATSCFVTGSYAAMAKPIGIESKILLNETLGGVTGTGAPVPPACSSDGALACLAVSSYPAIHKGELAGQKNKYHSSLTLAGIAGEMPDCAADGDINCLTNAAFKAMTSTLAAAKIAFGQVLGGITGSTATRPSDCASDGATACTTVTGFPSIDRTALAAKANKIVTGTSIAGVSGTLPLCSSDGAQGCLSSSTYRSMTAALASPKIYTGQTLGGVTGTAPLPPAACSLDNQSNCVTTNAHPAIDRQYVVTNQSQFTTSLTLAGVTGTMAPCSTEGQTNCWTSAGNPAVVATSLVPENIKAGSSIGGVSGQYPSASYPLVGSTVMGDLSSANFHARLGSASDFEYFGTDGTRYQGTGSALLIPSNLRVPLFGHTPTYAPHCSVDAEVGCVPSSNFRAIDTQTVDPWNFLRHFTLGGIQGKLVFPNNGVDLVSWNRTSGVGSSAGADAHDTTDDTTVNGRDYPTTAGRGESWTTATDIFIRDTATDTNANGICDSTEVCIFLDQNTRKKWARSDESYLNWNQSIDACVASSALLIPSTGWRLPTLKDVQQAYINGIGRVSNYQMRMFNAFYYTATSQSTNPLVGAAYTNPNNGHSPYVVDKATGRHFFCVHD